MPAGAWSAELPGSKFGDARSAELNLKMAETGRETGIAFAFDRMHRTPSTRLAPPDLGGRPPRPPGRRG
jgi:predicted DsbA family dithiol-disulfide isomerase